MTLTRRGEALAVLVASAVAALGLFALGTGGGASGCVPVTELVVDVDASTVWTETASGERRFYVLDPVLEGTVPVGSYYSAGRCEP